MNMRLILVAAVLLTACGEPAETVSSPSPASAPTPAATPPAAPEPAVPTATRATALGTIEALDAPAGSITIAHEAVSALNWPAMTMVFKAEPQQLEGLAVGQRVRFEFISSGAEATITTIAGTN